MTVQAQLDVFKALSYEEKLKIATNIITNLKERGNAQAQSIFDYMHGFDVVPDTVLHSIYEDFKTSVERIKQEKIEDDVHKFTKSTSYIQELKSREEQERVEENPEALLDQLS